MLNFVSENGKIVVLTNSCIVVRPTTNHTLRPSKAERPQTVQLFVSANASLGGVFLCPNAYALAVGRGKTSLPGKIATSVSAEHRGQVDAKTKVLATVSHRTSDLMPRKGLPHQTPVRVGERAKSPRRNAPFMVRAVKPGTRLLPRLHQGGKGYTCH